MYIYIYIYIYILACLPNLCRRGRCTFADAAHLAPEKARAKAAKTPSQKNNDNNYGLNFERPARNESQ